MFLSKEVIENMFYYNSESGKLYWKFHPHPQTMGKFFGKEVGSIGKNGYRYFGINNKLYTVHRIVWLLMTGEFPEVIDHINGNRSDNRFENLRISTKRLNSINQKSHREGRLPGCSFRKDMQMWQARIRLNGVKRSLGCFNTETEAHLAYMNALRIYNLNSPL